MFKHVNYNAAGKVASMCALLLLFSGCDKKTEAEAAPAPVASMTVGSEVDDSVITAKIKSEFLVNESVKSLDIKVTTMKGDVMLSGFVDNPAQIETSVSLAKGVTGVKNVNNQFSVKDGGTTVGSKIDDDVITTKVKSALLDDVLIKSFDIAAVTRNGDVQLSGFVNSQEQINHSIDLVQKISGVKSVQNHMTIKN